MNPLIDNPLIINNIFFPRATTPDTHPDKKHVKDGSIDVEEGIRLGYRCYIHETDSPVLLFFHGNGEVASDYDSLAPYYDGAGVSLLVVDFRGYGWSSGKPLVSRLLPDAQVVIDKIEAVFKEIGIAPERPLFVMGRSLGSAPATYLALKNQDKLKGVIIESGFADAPSVFRRLGIPIPDSLRDNEELPISNSRKLAKVQLPLLVIHGEIDNLIPLEQGQELYNASPAKDKQLLVIKGAGHNDVGVLNMKQYFSAIRDFVAKHSTA